MNAVAAKAKAQWLRELHDGPGPLLLANVWDVASARIVEQVGFKALATTSAGIANLLGYPDGENIAANEMLEWVGRIVRAVQLPVTADLEAGYDLGDVHTLVTEMIAIGAVGLNIEDADHTNRCLLDMTAQAERIGTIREVASSLDVPVVINARTDAYLLDTVKDQDRFSIAVERARAYRQAGGDCIFVPGLRDIEVIKELLRATPGPINILAGPGSPSVGDLARAGVRRISLGSSPHRAALGLLRTIAQELIGPGTYDQLSKFVIPYDEVNELIGR
jgi:2-methylisocitrate lyase-like PEP mutase family enzyme